MDLRISTGLNHATPTPRQAQSARLARWRDGAIAAQQRPVQPGAAAESADPIPAHLKKPDPFPYLLNPFGGFQEADAEQALRRLRKAEREPLGAVEPYRSPREIPEEAAAKAISKAVEAATKRQEIRAEQQATDRAQEIMEQEIAAEARRALLAQQRTQLKNRVEQLGSLLEVVIGRYAPAPAPTESTRLDTRQ